MSNPTCSGCLCSCMDIFFCFLPRLTKMDMHINQAGRYKKTFRIIYFCAGHISYTSQRHDFSIFNHHITLLMLMMDRIYNGPIFNQFQCLFPPSALNITMPYVLQRHSALLPESKTAHHKLHHEKFLFPGSSVPDE